MWNILLKLWTSFCHWSLQVFFGNNSCLTRKNKLQLQLSLWWRLIIPGQAFKQRCCRNSCKLWSKLFPEKEATKKMWVWFLVLLGSLWMNPMEYACSVFDCGTGEWLSLSMVGCHFWQLCWCYYDWLPRWNSVKGIIEQAFRIFITLFLSSSFWLALNGYHLYAF